MLWTWQGVSTIPVLSVLNSAVMEIFTIRGNCSDECFTQQSKGGFVPMAAVFQVLLNKTFTSSLKNAMLQEAQESAVVFCPGHASERACRQGPLVVTGTRFGCLWLLQDFQWDL